MIGRLLCFLGRHEWFNVPPLDLPIRRRNHGLTTRYICMRCPARRQVIEL